MPKKSAVDQYHYHLFRLGHRESKLVFYVRALSKEIALRELKERIEHMPSGRLNESAVVQQGCFAEILGTTSKGKCFFFKDDWKIKTLTRSVTPRDFAQFMRKISENQEGGYILINPSRPAT